jgi:cytosine deaminase
MAAIGLPDGYVAMPAAVEPHAHLDKAFLADVVTNPTGDLLGAIEAMNASRDRLGFDETLARAERAVLVMAANGYCAVRTHADVTPKNGLVSVQALAEVRRRLGHLIEIQIVALPLHPVTGPAGAGQRDLLEAALEVGADLVGGCPHLEAAGTRAATDVLMAIADAHGRAVDLHTDETLDPAIDGLGDLAAHVLATGFERPVTASHCVSLATKPEADQRRIAEQVAAAGIGVVALPATNLYLQGRADPVATPRGLTAVHALRQAGVVVAAGADNVQDPFNPVGRACPFETAMLMILTTHLLPDDAWAMVSTAAAAVVGVDLDPGDVIGVRARSAREAIAFGGPDRLVWRAGELQQRVEQHVGAGGDVGGIGVLGEVV